MTLGILSTPSLVASATQRNFDSGFGDIYEVELDLDSAALIVGDNRGLAINTSEKRSPDSALNTTHNRLIIGSELLTPIGVTS